jgi:hypothetical protein
MNGKRCYELLGLPENSSLAAVKKQFRALAKQYHPDLNRGEKATAQFQQLLEAYERILKQDFETRRKPVVQPHKTAEEVHRARWEKVNQRWKEEEAEMNEYYRSLVSGWRWKLKTLYAVLSLWIVSAMIADSFLPFHEVKDTVVGYEFTSYQSTDGSYVHEVKLRDHGSIYLANYNPQRFNEQPEIVLKQTLICRSNHSLQHTSSDQIQSPEIHFSLCRLRIPVFIFLGLSIILPFFKKPSIFLVLGSWINWYFSGAVLVFVLLFYFRFTSIFTLGYYP